jgi:hypothetical protein
MGTVHEAKLESGPERFALKILTDATPELTARFVREARLLEFLSRHPNIVRFRDAGEERGRAYLVMDLLSGGTLAERLKKGGISREAACSALVLVARALHFAHEAGVVHRDVKPSNILLDDAGKPYVADFGIAKVLLDSAKLTASGTVIGTASYMAPEQIDPKFGTVDRRADVYALGAVLYEVLAGRPPFEGSDVSVFKKALLDAPRPPSAIVPGIDPSVEALCLRALAKRPADRPQTAEEFARELEAPAARPGPAFSWKLATGFLCGALVAVAAAVEVVRERRVASELVQAQAALEVSQRALADSTRELSEGELDAAFAALGREGPRSSTSTEPHLWEHLAWTLETKGQAKRAAKAFLVASHHWAGSGDADRLERAADCIERAFELDLPTVVGAGAKPAAPLVEASRKNLALLDGGGPEAIRVARRRLIRFRLLRPEDDVPLETRQRLFALSRYPDPKVRAAARPWSFWVKEVPPLEELMTRPRVPRGSVRMEDAETWPPGWHERLDDSHTRPSKYATFELQGEALLWQPELVFLWSYLGDAALSTGRFGEGPRSYEVALSLEDSPVIRRAVGTLLGTSGRARDAVPHFRVAIEKEEELGRREVWSHLGLMGALVEVGGQAEARDAEIEARRALEIDKSFEGDPIFQALRARIREILGK